MSRGIGAAALVAAVVVLAAVPVAAQIDPERVLLISARFDRVIPPDRTRALWLALGRPRWLTVPTGHYQLVPYFWWAVGRGADHLDRVFGRTRAH